MHVLPYFVPHDNIAIAISVVFNIYILSMKGLSIETIHGPTDTNTRQIIVSHLTHVTHLNFINNMSFKVWREIEMIKWSRVKQHFVNYVNFYN